MKNLKKEELPRLYDTRKHFHHAFKMMDHGRLSGLEGRDGGLWAEYRRNCYKMYRGGIKKYKRFLIKKIVAAEEAERKRQMNTTYGFEKPSVPRLSRDQWWDESFQSDQPDADVDSDSDNLN